jgi:hypothetical protein
MFSAPVQTLRLQQGLREAQIGREHDEHCNQHPTHQRRRFGEANAMRQQGKNQHSQLHHNVENPHPRHDDQPNIEGEKYGRHK